MSPTPPGLEVAARPSPLPLDPAETAVIVVDMQQGFFGLGGAWDRAGVDVAGARAILGPLAQVLVAARRTRLPVIYLAADFGAPGNARLWDAARGARWLALAGTAASTPHGRALPPGAGEGDILPEVAPASDEPVIVKPRFSGFFETPLHDLLRTRGIGTLIVAGGTTSVCVESTVREAYFRDYRCLVLADCTAEPIGQHLPQPSHDATLRMVEVLFGWVTTSADLLRALAAAETGVR